MQKSETIDKLAAALCKFQSEVGTVKMSGFNPHFKSNFATPHDISDAIKIPLASNGLSVIQTPGISEFGSVITTMLMHSSGQWVSDTQSLMVDKPTPQGLGAAITYGRRYGISAILNLIVDTDDDGNSVSIPKQQSQQPAAPQSNYSMAPGFVKKTAMTGPELSEWVMNYGTPQVKGKKLKSCTQPALLGFIDWAKKTQASTGKPLADGVHAAMMNIHHYLDYLKTKPEPNVSEMVSGAIPPAQDPDDPMNSIPF